MSSTSLPHAYTAPNRVSLRRLAWAGLLTVTTAVVANQLLRVLVAAVVPLDPAFLPLTPGPIAMFTLLGTTLGAMVFAVIARRAARPTRVFRTVALVALIVSILPNLALAVNPAAAPFPGGSALNFGALILFHILAATVCVWLLPRVSGVR